MKPLPVSVTTRLVRGVVDAHAPLTALLDPRADVTRSLQSAWENEVAECMRERGLDYTPRPADEADDADPNGAMLAAMTPAERKGWDAALLGRVSEGDHEEDDSRVALDVTEHVSMAWSGDACAARADRALYGDDGLYRNLHMQLTLMREEAQARADHDPDYAEGLKVYAGCMRARGKSVPEAILDGEDTLDEAHEGPEAECQQTARLFERRRLAVASAEQDLAERNQHDLIAFQELQDEALEASETN